MTYQYPPVALNQLARHGILPRPTTPPSRVREYLNDLYRYEIRRLRDRLLQREFPRSEYAGRVTALRRSYWLLSLPMETWGRERGLDAPEAGTFLIVGPNFSPGVRTQSGASSEDPHVPEIRPYGSWRSPITAAMVAAGALRLGDVSIHGQDVWWTEGRADEGGRVVLRRRTREGRNIDVTPPPYNVRTRVHEYGGAPYVIVGDIAYFSNHDDQRLYRVPVDGNGPVEPCGTEAGLRFADGVVDRLRERLIYVVEDHRDAAHEPVSTIGAVRLADSGRVDTLIGGADFYASPRVSPDASRLAWVSWNHPDMPWDQAELWVADLSGDGSVGERRRVAGGPDESIVQPEWSPHGVLHFVSDRTGWWNLYRWIDPGPGAGDQEPGARGREPNAHGTVEPLTDLAAEFARPHWVFGNRTFAFASAGRILCSYGERGLWRLALLDCAGGRLDRLDLPYTQIEYVSASPARAVFLGGSGSEASSIVSLDLTNREVQVLVRSSAVSVPSAFLSTPANRSSSRPRTAFRPMPCCIGPGILSIPRPRRSFRLCSCSAMAGRPARPPARSTWASSSGPAAGSRSSTSITAAVRGTAARIAIACAARGAWWMWTTVSTPRGIWCVRRWWTAAGSRFGVGARAATRRSRP